jgi:hypothetical protein
MTPIHVVPLLGQLPTQHACAHEGMLQMQFCILVLHQRGIENRGFMIRTYLLRRKNTTSKMPRFTMELQT